MGWLNDSETEQNVFKGYEAGYTSMHIDFAILATCITTNVCDFGFDVELAEEMHCRVVIHKKEVSSAMNLNL